MITHAASDLQAIPRLMFIRARALLMIDDDNRAEVALLQARAEATITNDKPLLWRIDAGVGHFRKKQRRREESRQAFDDARVTPMNWRRDWMMRCCVRASSFGRIVQVTIPAAPTPTSRQKAKASFDGLTSRERDVARLIAHGRAKRSLFLER